MIDLAPHNPYSVTLESPVLVAAGCAVRSLDLARCGAVLTRPTTIHSRDLPPPRWGRVPAGVVYSHLPQQSVRILLRDEARRWGRLPVPTFASLLGSASELAEIAAQLDGIEGLAGLVLEVEHDSPERAVQAVRRATQLPLIMQLALEPTIGEVAQAAVAHGADALVLALPPLALAWHGSEQVHGSLYGPAVVPQVLYALQRVVETVAVPLIAQGGVADSAIAQSYLRAGAKAVLVDAARWGDPLAPARITTD